MVPQPRSCARPESTTVAQKLPSETGEQIGFPPAGKEVLTTSSAEPGRWVRKVAKMGVRGVPRVGRTTRVGVSGVPKVERAGRESYKGGVSEMPRMGSLWELGCVD